MPYEDCVGIEHCNRYQILIKAAKEGRSAADVAQDTNSCRRGYGCNQRPNYDTPYRGE